MHYLILSLHFLIYETKNNLHCYRSCALYETMHLDYFAQWKIYNKCLLNVCYYYNYYNYIPEKSIQLCRTGNYKFIVSDSTWTLNHVAVWLFLMCYLAWTQANTNSLPIISISHKWKCQAFTTIHKPLIHLTSLLLIDHLVSCTSNNRDHQAVIPCGLTCFVHSSSSYFSRGCVPRPAGG